MRSSGKLSGFKLQIHLFPGVNYVAKWDKKQNVLNRSVTCISKVMGRQFSKLS